MEDLSHWDFAEHFWGYDAAALILGVEPRHSAGEEHRIRVVMQRMALDYSRAVEKARWETFPPFDQVEVAREPNIVYPDLLVSVELEKLWRGFYQGIEAPFESWLANENAVRFENQEFSRQSVANWIGRVAQKSIYSFDLNGANVQDSVIASGKRWPWGNHHTEALGHLDAAAKRFWVNYDPSDPTTASINADVSEWLQVERKVSKTMADSIASMLRADGLPTGPRR